MFWAYLVLRLTIILLPLHHCKNSKQMKNIWNWTNYMLFSVEILWVLKYWIYFLKDHWKENKDNNPWYFLSSAIELLQIKLNCGLWHTNQHLPQSDLRQTECFWQRVSTCNAVCASRRKRDAGRQGKSESKILQLCPFCKDLRSRPFHGLVSPTANWHQECTYCVTHRSKISINRHTHTHTLVK